jgi:ABC-type multidrug transport system ATPase subunit
MLICARGLTFGYGGAPLFESLQFSTDQRLCVLVGRSGSGKTTLLRLISGRLRPTSGQIVAPTDGVFLVLQEDALFPWLSGWQNITRLLPVSEREVRAHPLFPYVRTYIDIRAHQMSFGQRRLLELMRAFLAKPRLLLLDEPLNFLDMSLRRAVVSQIHACITPDSFCVATTHHPEDFANLSCHILSLPDERPITKLDSIES